MITFRIHLTGLAVIVLLLISMLTASAQAPAPAIESLVLGQPIEREIKGAESQSFTVRLDPNQTARIEVVQKGVDIGLAAYRPSGEIFIQTESPSGVIGSDLILVTAAEPGEYTVRIEPVDPKAAPGKYIIKLAAIRPTVPQDHEINAAAKKLTKLGEEANTLRQTGTRQGRRQALENYREMIALSKVKQDPIWEVVALISSGLVYEQLGEIQNSFDFYLQGLKTAREAGSRQYEGSALNNLAVAYLNVGEYDTSISYLDQAIALQRETGNKRGVAVNLNNYGTAYLLVDDLAKAETTFIEALAMRREIKDQRGEGFVLNNLGQVFIRSGDTRKAADYLQQALTLRRAIGDRQGEAVTLKNLGKVALRTGDEVKALEHFEKANTLSKELGDRRIEAETLYWLAVIETDKGDLSKAMENIENGLRLTEQIRGELVTPDLRTSYFSTIQQFYELYIELLITKYEKTKDPGDLALSLQISERARTRSLVELLQQARVNVGRGTDAKQRENILELQDAVNLRYRQRTTLLAGKSTPEQVSKITNEINTLGADLEKLQADMRRENPRYAELTQGIALTAREIQALLDDDTVMLEYKLGDTRSFLWVVTKNSVEVITLPKRAEIETAAGDFYTSIVSRDKTDTVPAAQSARRLDDMVLRPVSAKMKDKRLVVVADGALQFTPFAALPTASANEIIVLPSANVLAELRRGGRPAAGKTLAIFADAVFEATDPRLPGQASAVKKPVELGKVLRNFNSGENLPRLLSSRAEAREIVKLVPKDQVISNMDFDASRENASGDELANYRILHFATHGLLDTKHPEFSGLVFSLYDKNGNPRDGFLRLNQIYNLNLNSDLVVLSACQTALGKDVRGEGLIGLTRGFMYAGARRVMATLWKVDDAATAEFMKRFYRNHLQKGLPAAAALHTTQIEMQSVPRYRAPYYWAGFTLQGDWRATAR